MQFFIYNNEEDFPKIFLFYFNKICNMFLSKVQQSYTTVTLSCAITEKKSY